MKVNGDTVATQGQLAKLLPLQLLIPKVQILLIMALSQDVSF